VEIAFHASGKGAKLMYHSVEFGYGILGDLPTAAHIGGLEFFNRDVDKGKVYCD
jgi:hypothetical protein